MASISEPQRKCLTIPFMSLFLIASKPVSFSGTLSDWQRESFWWWSATRTEDKTVKKMVGLYPPVVHRVTSEENMKKPKEHLVRMTKAERKPLTQKQVDDLRKL